MTNVKLTTALYEKMFVEQEKFKDWPLSQPPEEILMSLEYHDLPDAQARAMLKSPQPACGCIQGLLSINAAPHNRH